LNYEFVDENNVIFSGFTYNGVPSDGFNFGQDVKYDFPTPVTPTPSPSFVTPSPTPTSSPIPSVTSTPTPTSSPIPSVTSTPTPTPTPTSSPVCQPPGGLTVTADLSIFESGILKFFLSEIGTENEETVYATSYGGSERGQELNGWFKVAWNSDTSLWEFSQIFSEDGVIQQQLIATSADLYNGVWTMLIEEFPPIGTSQGEEFSCDWRYCFNVSGDTFSVNPGYSPIWSEIPLTEPPNGYFSINEGTPIFWSTGATSWFYAEGEGVLLSGGTRDALPIGSFNIDTGTTLTISSGVCEVTPLPTPFILRVDTTLGNGLDSFIISTSMFEYNYDVSWEEVGNPSNNGILTGQTGSTTVNFSSSGQYDLSIIGLFPAILNDFKRGDALKVIDIIQWGSNKWQSMSGAFRGCSNLSNYSATDSPDLSSVTSMNSMFSNATSFNQDISNWDVSSVTDMSGMFNGATSFNQPLSGWDVSNVTNMSSMFGMPFDSSSFNQDISGWNVSNVTNMSSMFNNTTSFNGNISGWNVSGVTDMALMFNGAASFNQDLSGWCVSQIPGEPFGFADGASSWILPKPVWGTCPSPSPYYTDFPDIVNQEVYIQTDGSFQSISQDGITYNISATLNEGGNTAQFSIMVQEDVFDNFFKDGEVEYDIQNALVYIHDNIGDTDYNNLITELPILIGMRSYTLYLTLDTTVNHNFSIFYFTGTAGDGEFINIINVSGNMDNAGLSLRPR